MFALYHECDVERNTLVMLDSGPITDVTKNYDDTSLGGRLRKARVAAGLKQGELAARAGLKSQGAVSMIEVGSRGLELPAATLFSLAKALGVLPHWLLTGKGPMRQAAPMPAPSPFRVRYSETSLELAELFDQIPDEDTKEVLAVQIRAAIEAAIRGMPTSLSQYEPHEYEPAAPAAAAPTPALPGASGKQPAKRQAAPSGGSTPSPAASRRRGR